MGQMLSVEDKEWVCFITTRTAGSKLWLINNKELEDRILGCLAKYQEQYGVIIYGFIPMGNHYHLLAQFPNMNRAQFMRDFNSMVARLVGRYVNVHGRRSVWARRYSYQIVPRDEDIKHWFYYAALNPVSSGLVKDVNQYPSYNSFFDAAAGRQKSYRWVDWSKYLMKKRYNPEAKEEDFTKDYTLTFSRLPGTSPSLSDVEYKEALTRELRGRQAELVQNRSQVGRGFMGSDKLRRQQIGSEPTQTKKSTRYSFRPIVLSICAKTRKKFLRIFYKITNSFMEASELFRSGKNLMAKFPHGTYPPHRPVFV